MTTRLAALSLLAVLPATAAGQEAEPVYQPSRKWSVELKLEGFLRQEWTDTISFTDEDRWVLRMKPRVEVGADRFLLGIGGDFIRSSDENTVPPPNLAALPLLRDNYDSRDARLDLAFVRADATPWLRLHAGRFPMPVRFTEMVWDRELRPQGGAVTVQGTDVGPFRSVGVTGLFARGSHVFPQDGGPFDFSDRETVLSAAAHASFASGDRGTIDLLAAYVTFTDLQHLEPRLRRQNLRAAGGTLALEYDVVDLVARYTRTGGMDLQLVADVCWNTAADELDRGVWLAAILGSTRSARARLEYTYATVDRDATLAAFGADDFLWVTGWEGHRGDLGIRISDRLAAHGVAQRQRFKDSPRVEDRDVWLDRYRLELRFIP